MVKGLRIIIVTAKLPGTNNFALLILSYVKAPDTSFRRKNLILRINWPRSSIVITIATSLAACWDFVASQARLLSNQLAYQNLLIQFFQQKMWYGWHLHLSPFTTSSSPGRTHLSVPSRRKRSILSQIWFWKWARRNGPKHDMSFCVTFT